MRFFSTLLCLALMPLAASPAAGAALRRHRAPARGPAQLSRRIQALLDSPAAAQAHWGISVTTLDGRLLYERNDARMFAPASNGKLLTTATALALLGPNATELTRVIAGAPPDAQGVVHGDLTLVGAGDASISGRAYPYLGHTDRPNPPLAALAALADQLQQRGVRRVEGNVVGDDTAFPQEPYGSGWAWDDLEWSWGAPVSALTVNDNIAYLTVAPGARPGDALAVSWDPEMAGDSGDPAEPAAHYYRVDNAARTSAAESQPSLGVDRPVGSRNLRIFGTLPAGGTAAHLAIAIQDPAEFAAMAFRQMLEARGIAVAGQAIAHHRASVDTSIYEQSVLRPLALPSAAPATAAIQLAPPLPAGAVVLASRTSVPLLQDLTVTNKVSQNLHAEIFLRLVGERYGSDGSIEEGARVVRAWMLRAGILPQDFFFYDGSGLSPQDEVTPRAMTALLRYVAAQPWGEQFRQTLPVGGVDGTLADRFAHGPLHGRVFAKTGTLDEVNTLSGYVTARSGRTLVFSILCNGHAPAVRGITKTIDAVLTAVAAAE